MSVTAAPKRNPKTICTIACASNAPYWMPEEVYSLSQAKFKFAKYVASRGLWTTFTEWIIIGAASTTKFTKAKPITPQRLIFFPSSLKYNL